MRFKFRLNIPLLRFSFFNEYEQCLFVSEIKKQQGAVDIGKGLTRAHFQTNSMILYDLWSGAKAFPKIIDSIEIEDS